MEAGKAWKRPVAVEYAVLTDDNGAEVAEWCGGEWLEDAGEVLVPTIHGQVSARPDGLRYVMHHFDPEEFYPIRDDRFAGAYDVEQEARP